MSTTLGEINTKLVEIKSQLDKLEFEKETDAKKIEAMIAKILGDTKDITEREDFGKEHLSTIVEMFKNAESKANSYDSAKDAKSILKNRTKVKEISATIQARKNAKTGIVDKFNELTKKQEVINKYKEKYDPQHLKDRQENKAKANSQKIDSNNKRIIEVADFKEKVGDELNAITANLNLMKELDEIETLGNTCETLEKNLATTKKMSNVPQEILDALQGELDEKHKNLAEKCKDVNTKNKVLKIDPKNVKTDISLAKTSVNKEITDSRDEVNNKLVDSEKKYGYTAGFEKFIGARLAGASSAEEFLKVFEEATKELEAENINYITENKNIQSNIESLDMGLTLSSSGSARSSADPTEEEIKAVIEADPQIKALAKPLTKKEEKEEIYKFLTEGKKGKIHPIAFLRSKFDRKAEAKWRQNYELDMREAAIKKITDARTNSENKRSKFMETLVHKVMTAKTSEVEEWNKDAEKKPGKVLTDVYEKMDDSGR